MKLFMVFNIDGGINFRKKGSGNFKVQERQVRNHSGNLDWQEKIS